MNIRHLFSSSHSAMRKLMEAERTSFTHSSTLDNFLCLRLNFLKAKLSPSTSAFMSSMSMARPLEIRLVIRPGRRTSFNASRLIVTRKDRTIGC